MASALFTGARVFDGAQLRAETALAVRDGRVADTCDGPAVALDGGYILPGLIDLQVNGGGGHQISGQTTVADIAAVCAVHAGLGTTGLLPTLITDTPAATEAVIAAGVEAARTGVPGFLGLHLEGPHLDPRRKGAHDPQLIRPMQDADLNRLCEAARHLPSLLVTLAPESATTGQISTLAAAGVIVSLGHSDCTRDEAKAAMQAGARCVTHLFNAMSQLGNREPGLVGAALAGPAWCGLIADAIHVDPTAIRIAMAAHPDRIFLVSDCMAAAGTDVTDFDLGGRRIYRRDGRLTLADGTLAGADLVLPQAMRIMVTAAGASLETAFAMATARPAACLGRSDIGGLAHGARADFIHLDTDLRLTGVWRAGQRLI